MSPANLELHETMFMHYSQRWEKQQFKNQFEKSWVRFHVNFHYEWICRLVPFADFIANSNLNNLHLTPSTK